MTVDMSFVDLPQFLIRSHVGMVILPLAPENLLLCSDCSVKYKTIYVVPKKVY